MCFKALGYLLSGPLKEKFASPALNKYRDGLHLPTHERKCQEAALVFYQGCGVSWQAFSLSSSLSFELSCLFRK